MISIKISRYSAVKAASRLPLNRSSPEIFEIRGKLVVRISFDERHRVTVANCWKNRHDVSEIRQRNIPGNVFFSRYVLGQWKIFVGFVSRLVSVRVGVADSSTEGTFSSRPSLLSPCSRCYHCRLFCGFRIICAFPRLYSCGSPFYRIIKSLSADCLLLSCTRSIPRYTVCCCIVLARGNAWCILGVLRVREREKGLTR